MLVIAIIIQAVMYPAIWLLQPAAFTAHTYFLEVIILCMGSVIMQTIGFGVIMSKTKGMDPVLYGQGRPFRHKLREEDEEALFNFCRKQE